MIKLVISWKYFEFIINIPFIHVYLYYFIILLGVCVSYDIQFDMIHDTKKSKIDSRYDSRFDNYGNNQFDSHPNTKQEREVREWRP